MGRREKRSKHEIFVALVAHHPLAARYVLSILQRNRNIKVSTNDDIPSLLISASGGHPLVFVIDGDSLPSPLENYLHSLRSIFRNAKTVVLGSAIPNDDFCRLLFLGIQGFISYGEVEDRLNAAVQAVWEGHLSVPPEVLEQFAQYASRLSQLRRGGRLLFSPREKHTLGLLQRRLSNKEIGAELGISERTVKFHLSNIFGKLGIHDRHSVTELVKSNVLLKWAAIKELSPTLSDAGPQPPHVPTASTNPLRTK